MVELPGQGEADRLSRALAEAYGVARSMRAALEEDDRPLAVLASLRVQVVEDQLESMVEQLDSLHEILATVRGLG